MPIMSDGRLIYTPYDTSPDSPLRSDDCFLRKMVILYELKTTTHFISKQFASVSNDTRP